MPGSFHSGISTRSPDPGGGSFSKACRLRATLTSMYWLVVLRSACPSHSLTMVMSLPVSMRCSAVVCRKTCGVSFRSFRLGDFSAAFLPWSSMRRPIPKRVMGSLLLLRKRGAGLDAGVLPCLQVGLDVLDGFFPERNGAGLPPFPGEGDGCGTLETQVAYAQVGDFLHAGSGVVEQLDECFVSESDAEGGVDGIEDGVHLFNGEAGRRLVVGLFGSDGLYTFVWEHEFRVFAGGVVEEGFDGGEPLVPGGLAVVALAFEVVEEVEDRLGVEHFHAEFFGLFAVFFAEMLDEQAQGVAIGGDGVFRCAAFVGEVGDEEAGDEIA